MEFKVSSNVFLVLFLFLETNFILICTEYCKLIQYSVACSQQQPFGCSSFCCLLQEHDMVLGSSHFTIITLTPTL